MTFRCIEKVIVLRYYDLEADDLAQAREKVNEGEEVYIDEETLETVESLKLVGYYDDRWEYHRLEELEPPPPEEA